MSLAQSFLGVPGEHYVTSEFTQVWFETELRACEENELVLGSETVKDCEDAQLPETGCQSESIYAKGLQQGSVMLDRVSH